MISRDYFEIDGKSSNTVDLYVDTIAMSAMAQRQYNEYTVEGRDESSCYKTEFLNDIVVPVPCYTFTRNYDTAALHDFIQDAKILRDPLRPDKVYRVKKVFTEVNYQGHDKTLITINFQCSPHRYAYDNPEIVVTNGDIIENKGSAECLPIVRLTISGDGLFAVGSRVLQLFDFPQNCRITIDGEKELVYDSNGNVLLNKTIGNLPRMERGNNTIAWSGGIDGNSVRLIKNERWR